MKTARAALYHEHLSRLLRDDLDWYAGLAAEAGGPVCELGCGSGRVALRLARDGHRVDAVDLDASSLDRLVRGLEAEPPEVRGRLAVHEADMRHFGADEDYALVLLPYRSFQAMATAQDRHQCLWNAWRVLRPGGRVALDLYNPTLAVMRRYSGEAEGAWYTVASTELDEGRTLSLAATSRYDLLAKQVHTRLRWTEVAGEEVAIEDEALTLGLVFRDELILHLELAGFAIELLRGGYRGESLEREDQDLVVVARKVGP